MSISLQTPRSKSVSSVLVAFAVQPPPLLCISLWKALDACLNSASYGLLLGLSDDKGVSQPHSHPDTEIAVFQKRPCPHLLYGVLDSVLLSTSVISLNDALFLLQ